MTTPRPPRSRNPQGEFSSGPAVGEPLPDFELRDQRGRLVRLAASRARRGAVVAFIRSVVW
ncbi:MAG: hypothetical protein FJ035_05090 [Chloroflexi bacterium]|nr:hypothetical protein [Chloroflexota bacterium]